MILYTLSGALCTVNFYIYFASLAYDIHGKIQWNEMESHKFERMNANNFFEALKAFIDTSKVSAFYYYCLKLVYR